MMWGVDMVARSLSLVPSKTRQQYVFGTAHFI